jgi:16S rRNA (guanine527-N7)-methyltransferase
VFDEPRAGTPLSPPTDLADAAATLFGERLPLAEEYARRLTTEAILRGLIGPHEGDRVWERHLLNCAVVGELIPMDSYVVDVGSGAGLPGIVLALARPDLSVVLVESLSRRTAFLSEVVSALPLPSVTVVRARAEECRSTVEPADVVTARAVAPLDRLARWCLPLARLGGRMLALKGSSAVDEIGAHRAAVVAAGGGPPALRRCGAGLLPAPTIVVEVIHERAAGSSRSRPAGGRSSGGRGRRGAAADGRRG